MAIPSLPLQNPCDTVTFKCSTACSLATKQYNYVYQSAVDEVTVAAAAQNAAGMNVFILQNTPAIGEEADCAVLGSGDSFLVAATGAISIGANLSCSTGGAGKLSTDGSMFYSKAKDVSTASGDIIVVATLTGQQST